jgi:hypothetical protein
MSGAGSAMPSAAWRSDAVLKPMGPMAGAILSSGRVRLHGATPNGQHFKAGPLTVWGVADSSAVVDHHEFGAPMPLPEQTHLVDLWMPQRGIFYAAHFRYMPVAPAAEPSIPLESPSRAAQ